MMSYEDALDDRTAIADAVASLAAHVDARRWPNLLALFEPKVTVDYSALFGGEPETLARDDLILRWQALLPGFTHTIHLIGFPLIELLDQSARASAPVVAWHHIQVSEIGSNSLWQVGGCYEIAFERSETAWRISHLALVGAWAIGNLELPHIARERAASKAARKAE